jgi:hypothetical protein
MEVRKKYIEMNIHFSHDDKFLDGFISNANQFTDTYNVYVVFSSDVKLTHTKSGEVIVLPPSISAAKEWFEQQQGVSRIYFHSIFYFYDELITHLQLTRFKLIWLFFGFEVFNLHMYRERLLMPITFSQYRQIHQFEYLHFNWNVLAMFRQFMTRRENRKKRKLDDLNILQAIHKMNYVGHFLPLEVESHIKTINKKIQWINWNYWGENNLTHVLPALDGNKSVLKILVGNSADYFNNHLDAFDLLHKALSNVENYEILVPLNYGGNKAYVQEVCAVGKSKFGERFTPLLSFMNSEEYHSLIHTVQVGFYMNIRSQAAGNINWLLGNGKIVFMHRKSPLYLEYKSAGMKIFANDEFNVRFADKWNEDDINVNRIVLNRLFGNEAMKVKYQNILNV